MALYHPSPQAAPRVAGAGAAAGGNARKKDAGMMTAENLIAALGLQPHPEGGWYRETWRAEAAPGERAAASAVLYVIQPGQKSHWNKVDADEIWLWHSGDPIDLMIAADEAGPVRTVRLGGDVAAGEQV